MPFSHTSKTPEFSMQPTEALRKTIVPLTHLCGESFSNEHSNVLIAAVSWTSPGLVSLHSWPLARLTESIFRCKRCIVDSSKKACAAGDLWRKLFTVNFGSWIRTGISGTHSPQSLGMDGSRRFHRMKLT